MTRTTHRYISSMLATFFCIGLYFYKGFSFAIDYYLFCILPFSFLFANLPDIDHPKSGIGKLYFRTSKFINKKFGHRGFTHSLLGMALVLLIFSFFAFRFTDGILLMIFFSFGYGGHILADMCTPAGVPLFLPFSNKPFHIMNIKTGSQKEYQIRKVIKIFSPVYIFFAIFKMLCRFSFKNFK